MQVLRQEDWLERARKTHRDRYDYSLVVYARAREKVVVVCRVHGPFEQSPPSHLRGAGCPACSVHSSERAEGTFIDRVRAVHGDRYDYSLTKYAGANENVTIVCPVHGTFEQKAYTHLQGSGCSSCALLQKATKARRLRMTTETFISRARQVHSERYDYSRARYGGVHTKLEIICRLHGPFLQTPNNHISHDNGCPTCGLLTAFRAAQRASKSAKHPHEDRARRSGERAQRPAERARKLAERARNFAERATELHSGLYSYDLSTYVDGNHTIEMVCRRHGPFNQRPANHLRGAGCPECSNSAASSLQARAEAFLERARMAHGDTYDYSHSVYLGANQHVTITCRKHGPFSQVASSHLRGHGCRLCARLPRRHDAALQESGTPQMKPPTKV